MSEVRAFIRLFVRRWVLRFLETHEFRVFEFLFHVPLDNASIGTYTDKTLSLFIALVAFADPIEFPDCIAVLAFRLIVADHRCVAFLSNIVNRNDSIIATRG